MDSYESVLLVIRECFVYRIPPLMKSVGYRASDWDVSSFLWKGRIRLVVKNEKLTINLEDNETGELFAACPYDDKGLAVEPVLDSSRYFVIRVEDDGRHAYLGMGFADRSEAFDFNVALQDFARQNQNEKEVQQQAEIEVPNIDYSLKEGQTISLNLSGKFGNSKPKDTETTSISSNFVLPPPPKGKTNSNDDFGSFETSSNQFEGWAKFE